MYCKSLDIESLVNGALGSVLSSFKFYLLTEKNNKFRVLGIKRVSTVTLLKSTSGKEKKRNQEVEKGGQGLGRSGRPEGAPGKQGYVHVYFLWKI